MNKETLVCLILLLLSGGIKISAQNLHMDVNEKGKIGYVNETGTVVYPYTLDEAYPFKNGLAKIRKGKKYGFLDQQGNLVGKMEYTAIESASNDRYKVAIGGAMRNGVLLGAQWGYLNKNAEVVVPIKYQYIGIFDDGIAAITVDGKSGFMDSEGKEIIPPVYSYTGLFNAQGFTWVNKGGKPRAGDGLIIGGKFGIIDKKGTELVPVNYAHIGIFDLPYARQNVGDLTGVHTPTSTNISYTAYSRFLVRETTDYFWFSDGNNKPGVISRTGEIIIPEGEFFLSSPPSNGLCVVTYVKKNKGNAAIYNVSEKKTYPLLSSDTIYCGSIKSGVARVYDGHEFYFFNTQGIQIGTGYTFATDFSDGVSVVSSGGKYGIMNTSGQLIVPTDCDSLGHFADGLILAKKNNLYGFFNKNGELAIPFIYNKAFDFSFGLASVMKDGKYGYINATNQSVTPFVWDDLLYNFEQQTPNSWGKKDGKWYAFNTSTNQLLFPKGYTNAGPFYPNGLAYVQVDSLYGAVNPKGEEVLPPLAVSVPILRTAHNYYQNQLPVSRINLARFLIQNSTTRNAYKLADKVADSDWDY